VVVEERERLLRGERPQPQRHLREFGCERIQVHAVDTPLGHLPPRPVDVVVLLDRFDSLLGRLSLLCIDYLASEIVNRACQEVAASHRRIENFQLEYPLREFLREPALTV